MSGGKVLADQQGLLGLAKQLRNGADDLDGAASSIPGAPDAGLSTAGVGAAVAALARSGASLMLQSEDNASKVNASSGSYGATENIATRSLDGVLQEVISGSGSTDPLGPLGPK